MRGVISKSKMSEVMPEGFDYSSVYEKVMMISAD